MIGKVGRVRWSVVALLFGATAINYIDRQTIAILKPTLTTELHWTNGDYANILLCFQAAYALSYIGFGRVVDKVGAKTGYTIATLIWGVAATLHAGARSVGQFMAVRFMLGVGEAGNFPAGLKSVSEWFPAKERAFAIGIFNAGANIGALITPLLIPWIVSRFGWPMAFLVSGSLIFVWLGLWRIFYRRPRDHKQISKAELAHVESDPVVPFQPVRWMSLLRIRETWAYAGAKFLTDPIWAMFLYWLPDFLGKAYGLDLRSFGLPLVAIYLLSDVGSMGGGWLSSRMMARGVSVNRARKVTLLICALCVPPLLLTMNGLNLWVTVALLGLATAGHQGFSANLFALSADMFPSSVVGSVVGIGGTLGTIGSMVMTRFVGYILDTTGSYVPVFSVAASAYLLAILWIHVLCPNIRTVDLAAK